MGTSMLIGGEGIPQTTVQTDEGPQQVADIRALKDPTSAFRQSSGQRRPAYFLRVSKAVPTPPGMNRDVISENNMEMQQLLGYVPVEPDGSVKAEVPADTALAISVVDADGRALQVHTNWLHFLPGERRTCNGCHSPRRGSAINAAPIAGDHANTTMAGQEVSGESMAETRTRLNPAVLQLSADMVFDDIWTPAASGVTPEASIQIDYAGLTTPAPRDGVINYEEVIQPLWDKACVSCHGGASPAAELDLTSSLSGNGRLLSYNELMIGDPVLGADGLPVIRERDGELEVEREDPLIDTGSARDGSRASYFAEVLFARELRHPELLAPGIATTHGGLLNASELRLVAEWIDLGAQYYNSPFARAASNPDGSLGPLLLDQFRAVPPRLSEADFESDVHPVLMNRCAGCHQPRGNDSAGFETSNFVLTGSLEGDYNMALGMVNNVMDPAASMLLARPASDNSDLSLLHPQIELEDGSQVPVLSASADDDGNNSFGDYTVIFNWINAVN
jgi:mono/diheme cytochrome c family protein